MTYFIVVCMGLLVGSFLNVCIYRMPQSQSVVLPRSHCPKCKHTIPWHDNVPLLSYVVLGGKCRFCKGTISLRYAIVELLTAGIFVLLVSQFGINIITVLYIMLCCALVVSTFIDFEYQIIPDEITIGGMVVGLIASFSFPQLHGTDVRWKALLGSFFGLLAGGVSIYIISKIGTVIFKKKLEKIGEEEAMGGGDIKFLAMIGSFLGLKGVLFVFFLAPFFGSVVGIIAKLKNKADIIPYGPYLSLATLVVIVWGEKILKLLFPYM